MENTQQSPVQATSAKNSSKKKVMWLAIAGALILAVITVFVTFEMTKQQVLAEANVTISQEEMTPSTIQLKAGQALTITNSDESPHGLEADASALPGFETPEPINSGDSYTYTFETAGTYHFYDPASPQTHNATVIVE